MNKNRIHMLIGKKSYELEQAIKNQKVVVAAQLDKELVALNKRLNEL